MISFQVKAQDQGKTIFQVLKKQYPVGLLHRLFRKRDVKLSGVRVKPETFVTKGDSIEIYVPAQKKKEPLIDILLEHRDFLVIHKPKGIGVHEGKTISFKESLLSKLIAFLEPKGIIPYLVHRLDFNTSGCLLVAKSEAIAEEFEKLFEEGKIQKQYLALVQGLMERSSGSLQSPLPGRTGVLVPAVTFYRVLKKYPKARVTLVEAGLKTGRKHQIRLHFSKIGHPIVMDQEYGNFAFNKLFRQRYKLKSQFLHAKSLEFEYQGEKISVEAPLPGVLEKVLKDL